MLKYAMAAGLAALTATSAQAAVTFNVQASFTTPGGTPAGALTGTFTTNDALTSVTGYNLIASVGATFFGFNYLTSNSSVTAQSLPQFFQLDSTTGGNELRLYFTSPLTMSGGTISSTFSYESETSGGNRLPTGTVTRQVTAAVPEPAGWAMMIAGFGAVGYAMRRRRKLGARIAFA